ncbi:MAG: SPASM domain-containing protein, partial [Desulfamplus sp.]|nr:SPASM domain-containing protein [Desulfamplus sp.]
MKQPIFLFHRLLLELQSNCNRECFFCNRVGDLSGKRIGPDGKKNVRFMPTENALDIMNQAKEIGFNGLISFHHMSEPFLDPRIIDMAWEAKKRGMIPYEHTNGDMLKDNDSLCKAASEVFKYIVIGLYDYQNDKELSDAKQFWQHKLHGTQVRFSLAGQVFPRTFAPFDTRMFRDKKTYPHGVCQMPLFRLIIHYDGNVALCCEDMMSAFELGNAFQTPIRDIWYSKKHVQIIQDLAKGDRTKYPLCSVCPIPPSPSFIQRLIGKVVRAGKKVRNRVLQPDPSN